MLAHVGGHGQPRLGEHEVVEELLAGEPLQVPLGHAPQVPLGDARRHALPAEQPTSAGLGRGQELRVHRDLGVMPDRVQHPTGPRGPVRRVTAPRLSEHRPGRGVIRGPVHPGQVLIGQSPEVEVKDRGHGVTAASAIARLTTVTSTAGGVPPESVTSHDGTPCRSAA